ncbi:carboxymuconolactone decarboxylase family protein [Nocardiopsis sp. NPDC058631]|uniref:carboxymuconolactone decarboxylase family protein n=1 Tax=Nocardiopsis sp. NPDC058631 TaxID=3346566 RepID=UPI003648C8A6
MLRTLIRAAVRRSLRDVRHVRPVAPREARGATAALHRQLERDFGVLAPPVALLTPAPECAAATWVALRESLLVPRRTGRAAREAVATAVSRENTCPYCVEVHGATLGVLGAADGGSGGGGSDGGGPWAGLPAPTDPAERAELGAVVLTFHHINRLVNVFLPESPLPAFAPPAVRGMLRRATAATIASGSGRPLAPGAALDLLPEAALRAPTPPDLAWAAGEPRVLRALTAATAAVDAAGERVLTARVRDLLLRHLGEHGTGPAGVSSSWTDGPLDALPPSERALGRLALLTARASYQVTDDTIAACREAGADDPALVRAVSWAAMAAARQSTHTALTGETGPPHPPPENERNHT